MTKEDKKDFIIITIATLVSMVVLGVITVYSVLQENYGTAALTMFVMIVGSLLIGGSSIERWNDLKKRD